MCCACEPRLPALKTPKAPHRAQPTGPQYFTFDPIPEVTTSSVYKKTSRSTRVKKKSRRVLYPRVVKRYYPTEERSVAKRLLVVLLAVVFFQIYSAEEDLSLAAAPSAAQEGLFAGSEATTRESRCEASPVLEQPAAAAAPPNATGDRPWGTREAPASAVIDITQFLLRSRAAF